MQPSTRRADKQPPQQAICSYMRVSPARVFGKSKCTKPTECWQQPRKRAGCRTSRLPLGVGHTAALGQIHAPTAHRKMRRIVRWRWLLPIVDDSVTYPRQVAPPIDGQHAQAQWSMPAIAAEAPTWSLPGAGVAWRGSEIERLPRAFPSASSSPCRVSAGRRSEQLKCPARVAAGRRAAAIFTPADAHLRVP